MKTLVVVNPNSSNGSTGREWPTIRKALQASLGPFEEHLTQGHGHATVLVREGLVGGAERIVSVGGDGTNNEVVNGFFEDSQPINPAALLGFVPRGCGGDLRKTLGIERDLSQCLPILERSHTRPVDLGQVKFVEHNGEEISRLFINITSFGLAGLVDQKVNQSSKALGGKISFLFGTLKALAAYRNKRVHLKVRGPDGETVLDESMRINNVAVANGQYFGGGMWVAPHARIDDGLFDVVVLGDIRRSDLVRKIPRVYKGTHLSLPKVRSLRGVQVAATSEEEVLIDMDGEQPGRLPLTLDILPGAIRLIVPR